MRTRKVNSNGGATAGAKPSIAKKELLNGRPRRPTSQSTLRDVALHAQVSLMTVSNVVNGKFGSMSAETRQRVEETIRVMNYRPHISGRNLRLAKRLSIGMIIVDRSPTFLADPFTTRLVAGLSNYLSERGYSVTLQGLKPEGFEDALCIRNIRTDGLCVFLSGTDRERHRCIDILGALGLPIILFQEWWDLEDPNICLVRQDDRAGGIALAEHVVERGARTLLLIKPGSIWPAIQQRESGVRVVVSRRQPRVKLETLECSDASYDGVRRALAGYTASHSAPDAVIAGNDQMGIAAMKFFREIGYRVPQDILITGFNGFEFRMHSDPILTTVKSAAYELGSRGGAELIARIQRGAFTEQAITLPVKLDLGGTT